MEYWIKTAIGMLVPLVEACGALVITAGVLRTVVFYIGWLIKPKGSEIRSLRLRLGQSLVMGLEFQVAADILKTSISPTWNEILLLAALIGLRTVLNYLLEFEIKALDRKEETCA